MKDFSDIAAAARSAHGVITLAQLRALGRSKREVDGLVARGELVRRHRGVYVLAGSKTTWRQRVLAAVVAAGPEALASHRTGGALWRYPECRENIIEVTVPAGSRRRIPGVIVHESDSILAESGARIDGIPVTSAALTVLDLARFANERRVGMVADDAVRRQLTTFAELHRLEERLPRVGRRRATRTSRVLAVRPASDQPTDSVLEDDTVAFLAECGFPAAVSQLPVWVEDRRYDADLGWPELRVVIECDGGSHATAAARSTDGLRRDDLQADGWIVLTVTHKMLRDDPDRLRHNIARVLRRRAA